MTCSGVVECCGWLVVVLWIACSGFWVACSGVMGGV